jgi:hypothetical protein
MVMKKVILLAFLVPIFVFCKRIATEEVAIIDISESLGEGEKVLLSTIADSIDYIQLQTDTSCLIGQISDPAYNIKVHNGRVFISDGTRLLTFNLDGNFLNQIGQKGRGPGEFLTLSDFAILQESNRVVVFSKESRKAFFYTIDGLFETEITIDFYPTRMTSFNNKLIFISPPGRRDLTDYFTITVIDETGKIIKRLIERKNEREIDKKSDIALAPSRSNVYKMDSSLYYFENIYDTVWKISKDLSITTKTLYYYGEEKRPIETIILNPASKNASVDEILSDAAKYVIPQWYIDSPRYLFSRLVNKGNLNHIVYDKSNGSSRSLVFLNPITSEKSFMFFNDLDGGLPFWPLGAFIDGSVFRIIHGFELRQYLLVNIDIFQTVPAVRKAFLQNIIDNADINDNPILMIVYLKK